MADEVISEAQAVWRACNGILAGVHVSIPATIHTYDMNTQTCSARPVASIRRVDPDTDEASFIEPQIINNIPVAWPAGDGWCLHGPLVKGSSVVLVFSERAIDEWIATGADINQPMDPRRHDLSDAIAWPGGVSPANGLPAGALSATDLVLYTDTEMQLGDNTATEHTAKGESNDNNWNSLVAAIATGIGAAAAGDGGAAALGALQAALVVVATAGTKIKVV